MSKSKKFLPILIALVVGIGFVVSGTRELLNSKRLAKTGKATGGHVVDASEFVSGRLRHHTYYLSVEFQPENAGSLTQKIKVSKNVYTRASVGGAVKVFYLAEDPTVCQAGDAVEIFYGTLVWGIVILIAGAFLVLPSSGSGSIEELADKVEAHFARLQRPRYEYVPANAADFKQIDLAFYNNARQLLEQQGYTMLADEENTSLRGTTAEPTFLRYLVSRDQTNIGILYHFKRKALPLKESKVLDLETWFSNGTFVLTSNAKSAGGFDSPPSVDSFYLPTDAPIEAILQAHQVRVERFLAQSPGVQAVKIAGMPDVRRAGDELQRIKSEYRLQAGLSKEELERITGKSGPMIDELAGVLARRHEERLKQSAQPAPAVAGVSAST